MLSNCQTSTLKISFPLSREPSNKLFFWCVKLYISSMSEIEEGKYLRRPRVNLCLQLKGWTKPRSVANLDFREGQLKVVSLSGVNLDRDKIFSALTTSNKTRLLRLINVDNL